MVAALAGSRLARRPAGQRARRPARPVATVLAPFVSALLGSELPFGVRFWDGSEIAPGSGEPAMATVVVRSPQALRRVLYGPDELGFGRAYVAGELDVEGDLGWLLSRASLPALGDAWIRPATWWAGIRVAIELGVLGWPLPPPAEEFPVPGLLARWDARVHDAASISHHYDVGNEFYQLVLGPTMAYSCARFATPGETLEVAQEAKHDLICRKLGLRPGMRLLDIGCGWGAMARHAARHYGAQVLGITLAAEQQRWAARATEEAGLSGQVEIRLADFRELQGAQEGGFDAVCSIGMFEHVSSADVQEYFATVHGLLRPGGRVLNHAISQPQGTNYGRRSFLVRYVFPNGELRDVGATLLAMQQAGFEARDVEGLREHYALTLRRWLSNLEAGWEEAVSLVGAPRARIWRLYMTASVKGFEQAEVGIHQVLGVRCAPDGSSGMPLTRADWG